MTLRITREKKREFDTENYYLHPSMLNSNGTHLFIASNKWDAIIVDLCPELNPAKLHYLPSICTDIKICNSPDIEKYVDALLELFPNKGGQLRRCKLSGHGARDVVKEYIL